MDTRIEIYRDGLWRILRLQDSKVIKYNALINKIGDPTVREISHTNTFSLPPIHQNTNALNINLLSATSLAAALNKRYPAKYYVEGKLLQQGFLIINNTGGGKIQVNFIDKALEITEKWGSTTFKELLKSEDLQIPEDYRLAILEMASYNMSKSELLTPLSEVGTRGYNLALFPNALNAIGDDFQLQLDPSVRLDNSFNPYQSRPIFNAKALFDLACEAYGYSATFDDSINWEKIADIFMVEEGLNSNKVSNEGQFKTTFPSTKRFTNHWSGRKGSGFKYVIPGFYASVAQAIRPIDVPGWSHPDPSNGFFQDKEFSYAVDYRDDKSIFVPNISESTFGQIKFSADLHRSRNVANYSQTLVGYSCWENATSGGAVIFEELDITEQVFESGGLSLSFTVEKNQLAGTPAFSNGKLIGVIFSHRKKHRYREQFNVQEYWENTVVTETYLTEDVISYDDNGQYIANNIDLRHATPNRTIKELLSSIMEKEGILLNIDSVNKNVKFFSYGLYRTNKELGNFSDWSDYFQQYISPNFNTDYGNNYAKKNEISLAEPYLGNAYDFILKNQGDDSKYKDFAKHASKLFKDVEAIHLVENSTSPYNEYTNTGLGLVEKSNVLTNLNQVDDNGTVQGSIPALQNVANINYSELPNGITEWYTLVDSALKGTGTFLIPVQEIKTLDISQPIYVEGLGGFYIIEKIDEYVDAQTLVKVHLIKLLEESPLPEEPDAPSIIDLVLNYNGNSSWQMSLEKNIVGEDMEVNQNWSSNYSMTLDLNDLDTELIMNQDWSTAYSMTLSKGPQAFKDIEGNQDWSSVHLTALDKAPAVGLQEVTNVNAVTTNEIKVEQSATQLIAIDSANDRIYANAGTTNKNIIKFIATTADRTHTLQNKSGTIAHLDDITAGTVSITEVVSANTTGYVVWSFGNVLYKTSAKFTFNSATGLLVAGKVGVIGGTSDDVLLGNGTTTSLAGIVGATPVDVLSDLSDVTSAAVTSGFVLVADGSEYVGRALVASDVSDFDTEVSNNSSVVANTAKISYTDAAKVAFISVTQAVNLDTMESNIVTNNAKVTFPGFDTLSADYGYTEPTHIGTFETILGNPATNGFILSSTAAGVRSWIVAPAGVTNLSVSKFSTTNTIQSSTGLGINLTAATASLAGLVIAGGAQVFSGEKTFNGDVYLDNAELDVTGGTISSSGNISTDGSFVVNSTGGFAIVGKTADDVLLANGGTTSLAAISGGIALTDLSATTPILYNNTSGVFTHSQLSGYKHIPSGGALNQYLKWSSDGTAVWASSIGVTNLTISKTTTSNTISSDTGSDAVITGATSSKAGLITTGAQTISGSKTFTNNITALDFIGSSDERLKENIVEFIPRRLNTKYKSYNFIKNKNESRVGLIAQEVEIENPEFVREDADGTKSISYIDLHSEEIAYLKAQDKLKDLKIKELEEKLNEIINKLK